MPFPRLLAAAILGACSLASQAETTFVAEVEMLPFSIRAARARSEGAALAAVGKLCWAAWPPRVSR